MPLAHQKVMFEIYREGGYDRQFRVVYFTELEEHRRDEEINRALAGEHFLDGFLGEGDLAAAKARIRDLLARLNRGEAIAAAEAERSLNEFLV